MTSLYLQTDLSDHIQTYTLYAHYIYGKIMNCTLLFIFTVLATDPSYKRGYMQNDSNKESKLS